ncbi:MAG: UTRA domain-containing protein, partial [Alphaproteobacteria bacterium]
SPSSSATGHMEGLLENLLMMGLETDVEMLQFDYVPAPPQVADALHMDAGALVQHAVRVRKKDGKPFSYLVTYLPGDIGRAFSREELASRPLLALLERSGIKIARARQTITATLADNAIAPALQVKVSSPLLKVLRVVFNDKERPVEYITAYYRPDLYQLNLNLSRVQGDEVNTWAAHH